MEQESIVSLTAEEVRHIALLSRLELSDEEVERFTRELGSILEYVEQLKELNVDGVEPMSHAIPMANVFRGDEVGASLDGETALSNAPERDGPFFLTPRVTE